MNTEISVYGDVIAAEIAEQMKSDIMEINSFQEVKVIDHKLHINNIQIPNNKIDCVVLESYYENVLYLSKYKKNEVTNPDCVARGFKRDQLKAEGDKRKHPQCRDCEYNQWDPVNKSKKCSNKKVIILTSHDPKSMGVLFRWKLPVTSVRKFDTYATGILTTKSIPINYVVTNIEVKPDDNSYGVYFNYVEHVSKEFAAESKRLRDNAKNRISEYLHTSVSETFDTDVPF